MTAPNNKVIRSLPNEQDMQAVGAQLAEAVGSNGAILFLEGPLGAGKTTLTRGFLRGLGYSGKVKSPTYTLVEPYELPGKMLFHFDLYRLTNPDELEQMGIRDYFIPEAICLIEWPELGFDVLPEPDLSCYIESDFHSGRNLKIEPNSSKGEAILRRLQHEK